jgi:hypothetical protein
MYPPWQIVRDDLTQESPHARTVRAFASLSARKALQALLQYNSEGKVIG